MQFTVQTSFSQTYQYGSYSSKTSHTGTDFDTEFMGKATSRTTSSDNGKNIGIMTIGNREFIAEYADSSTEQDPIIKVGGYEVRVNDVNPKNATEIEMFALTSYMDDKGLTDNTGMKTFNKMRAYSSQAEYNGFCNGIADPMTAWSQNRDWTSILQNAKETYLAMPKAYEHGLKCQNIIDSLESWSGFRTYYSNSTSKTVDLSDAIKMFEYAHKISAQELKEEKDWRDMTAEEWDKMLEGVDKYIDAFKEHLREMKEMQDEAVQKAVMEADPKMRTIAASSAALAIATGFDVGSSVELMKSGEVSAEESADHEKNWTKNLKTDDQAILMIAKEAQKMESQALPKYQEARLIGDTSVGVSYTGTTIECASFEEGDEKKKIWTITCVDAEGISSKKCQNGKVLSSWQLKYKSSEDANRVDEFLAEFKNDENLRFTGIKVFWTMFLGGNTSKDDLTFSGGAWEWTQ